MKTYRNFASSRRIHVATHLVRGDVNPDTRGTYRTLTSKHPIGRAQASKLDGPREQKRWYEPAARAQ